MISLVRDYYKRMIEIWCDNTPHKTGFYEEYGIEFVEAIKNTKDHPLLGFCNVIIMLLIGFPILFATYFVLPLVPLVIFSVASYFLILLIFSLIHLSLTAIIIVSVIVVLGVLPFGGYFLYERHQRKYSAEVVPDAGLYQELNYP